MFEISKILEKNPFNVDCVEKKIIYKNAMYELTKLHYDHCIEYRKIVDFYNLGIIEGMEIEKYPFIPVRLFKEFELLSVPKNEIYKAMTSSGTTGQKVSKIFLDKTTSINQSKVLVKIMSSYLGNKRLPMLIIDTQSILKERNLFSARGAGILGFSMIGYDQTYALDEHMEINIDAVNKFIEKHQNENIFLFGFTSIAWEHFFEKLNRNGKSLNLPNGIFLHGGGWKKLISLAISAERFKKSIENVTGIKKVYDYYGMVEQTGSICVECEHGFLHTSVFSDILIRDHKDFSVLKNGERGLVQMLSLLPSSYPGHSILTEDIGELFGEDDCKCGRKGKYFKIHGRVKNAEIRGCSDTYASNGN